MAWDPPSNEELAPGKPGKASLARRIRDLTAAMAARESGAPWVNGQSVVEMLDFGYFYAHGLGGWMPHLVGEWTVPDGVTRVEVLVVGGGGAGGDPIAYPGVGSGGGAGGVTRAVLHVEPGQVIPAVLGAPGMTDATHPEHDTSQDNWVAGDGGRTSFGGVIARGGKRGSSSLGASLGYVLGGLGGSPVAGGIGGARGGTGVSTIVIGPVFSGRGAASIFGSGGSGSSNAGGISSTGWRGIAPGSGGGGGVAKVGEQAGGPNPTRGGRGAVGAILLRY